MKIEFGTKNYTASDKLKDVIIRKVERLDKFFEDPNVRIKIMLKAAKEIYTLELTIVEGTALLRSEVSSENMFDNIDIALPKLEKQLIKHRTKLLSKSKKLKIRELSTDYVPHVEEKKSGLVRSKTFELSPMTVEDAIDELELVGHSFYVFLNKSTKAVNVVYRRNDGDYGLIETIL